MRVYFLHQSKIERDLALKPIIEALVMHVKYSTLLHKTQL